MRILIMLAAAAAASGCTPAGDTGNGQLAGGEPTTNAIVPEEEIAGATPTPTPANALEPAGECGAADYQWLVGEKRSRIPEQPEGATWRVTCTECPVTMDYSPSRMNIFYDQQTEVVETIRCG